MKIVTVREKRNRTFVCAKCRVTELFFSFQVLLLALASSASTYDIVDSNSIDDDYSAGAIAVNAATAESGEEEEEEQYYDEEEGLFLVGLICACFIKNPFCISILRFVKKI